MSTEIKPQRRSPLCATCGDLTIKSTSARVLTYILFGVVLVFVGYVYLFPVSEIGDDFFLFVYIMLGVIAFGLFVLLYVSKKERQE